MHAEDLPADLDGHAKRIKIAMESASGAAGEHRKQAHRQWMSRNTLDFLLDRDSARLAGHMEEYRTLGKMIRHAIQNDKRIWLEDQLQSGPWLAVRQFRKGAAKRPNQINDFAGSFVDSNMR